MEVAVTIDVHPNDDPTGILCCNDFFLSRNIPVTFFVSTAILGEVQRRAALRTLQNTLHELGTHGHTHTFDEISAFTSGGRHELDFLYVSKAQFGDFFGHNPTVFRSPSWCRLGSRAIDELIKLGYRVDCSATPQRPGILSSFPLESPWILSPRKPHWLREGLLEVPTSTLLLPLASPSFAMLREKTSRLFLKLLMAEAELSKRKILVVSFDTQDFNKNRKNIPLRRSWRQLVPLAWGGLQWRYWLRTYDPETIFSVVTSLFDLLSKQQFVTLTSVWRSRTLAEPNALG